MAKKSTRLSSKLPLTAAGILPKADVLERWQQLPANKTLAMEPKPADKGGSSYEEDSIRLTGSLKYIDSVLSNLRGLLRFENTKTRLDVAFAQQKDKVTRQPRAGKYVCYIKVVEKVRTTRARAATPAPTRATRPRAAPQPPPPASPRQVETYDVPFGSVSGKSPRCQRGLENLVYRT